MVPEFYPDFCKIAKCHQPSQELSQHLHFYTHIFNGCYAVLMFIVVIFFLIYGVEVFFKVCALAILSMSFDICDDVMSNVRFVGDLL